MKQTRLGNICKDILAHWRGEGKIDEEQCYVFFDGVLDKILDPEEELTPDYKKVSAELREVWQYKDFSDLTPEEAFLYGSLWGGIQLAGLCEKRENQRKTVEKLTCVYENKAWFFEAIYKNPGIRHKDLAMKGNQSTSQLSQFVSGVVKEGLIAYDRVGREKYYYLQKRGELVYRGIEKKLAFARRERMKQFEAFMLSNDVSETSEVAWEELLKLSALPLGNAMKFNGIRADILKSNRMTDYWEQNNSDKGRVLSVEVIGKEDINSSWENQVRPVMDFANSL